jgi:translocation and assembly module TamB
VEATLRGVAFDRLRADSATLAANGTVGRHDVTAELSSSGARVRMALSGGYRDRSWQGEILRLSGSDGLGPWRLVTPAPVSLSPGHASISPITLSGAGEERLSLAAELDRDPAAGLLRAEWVKMNLARAGHWLTGVTVAGTSSGSLRMGLRPGGRLDLSGHAALEGEVTLDKRRLPVERAALAVTADAGGYRGTVELRIPRGGTLRGSFTSPSPPGLNLPGEGRVFGEWSGIDLALLGPWLPAEAAVTGRVAGRLEGNLRHGARLDLNGSAALTDGTVGWHRQGDTLDAVLQAAALSFSWQGVVLDSDAPAGTGRLVATARLDGTGTYGTGEKRIPVEHFTLRLDGDERGERLTLALNLAGGGSLHGSSSSPTPAGLAIPDQGEVSFGWREVDAGLLRPWLPDGLGLEGRLSGRGEGRLLAGRVELAGEAVLAGGKIRGERPEGEVNTELRSARVSWLWKGEELSGTVDLSLAGHGQARGSFRLPLPARLPAALDPHGAMRADLTGKVDEKGILSALFPGLMEESHGELDLDLHVTGTPGEPRMAGSFRLSGGGAYLPSAGIHVEEVRFDASLEKGFVRIDSFRAVSGPGHIEGAAVIQLAGRRVTGFRGDISGERFRTVYLPELQLLTSPRLSFEGTAERLVVRGDVTIPELLILEPSERGAAAPSKDVIVEGRLQQDEKRRFPLGLDVRVRVILGNDVRVKAAGIDARLEGNVELALSSLDRIGSKGEISVVKGRYRAYGLDLDIVRGRLYYAGGPFSRPFLDILALRTIDDVRAGVTVGGVLQAPVIKLYSEPAMTDVDTMAYMVLGHPLAASGEQASLVAQAAGALLTTGQSFVLQDQIKNRLGLSTLEMQTVGGATPGTMGYREVTVTPPPGISPAKAPSAVSQSLLTVGKYLTPELYVSYGRSLFTGANLFRLRYDLFKHLQVETQTGSESGVDVYYKIYFH